MRATMRSERSVVVRSHRALALALLLLLGVLDDAAAQNLDALLVDLRSPDESIRRTAGRALLPVLEERYADALQGLIAAAGDPDPAVGDGALALLAIGGGLSPENATLAVAAASAYASALASASTATRRNAAQALGAILPHPPAAAAPALMAALEDPDLSVRRSAARSLGRLEASTSDVETALLATLQTGVPGSVRGAAAEALGSLGVGGLAVVEALVVALADADPFVRQESVGALAGLAGKARGALEALEAVAAGDDDPLIRELAAAAVITIGTSNTPPDCSVAVATPDRLWAAQPQAPERRRGRRR